MKIKKLLGGALLTFGIILAFWGISYVNSTASQLQAVLGRNDPSGMISIIVGSAAAIGGAVLLFSGQSGKE